MCLLSTFNLNSSIKGKCGRNSPQKESLVKTLFEDSLLFGKGQRYETLCVVSTLAR